MKATFDLPNDLLREMKLRAVHENRKLKDVVEEILRRGLAHREPSRHSVRRRVKLPLIQCGHPAAPKDELTADKAADLLLKQEVEWLHEAARH